MKVSFGGSLRYLVLVSCFILEDKTGSASINEYIWKKTKTYFDSYDCIYADNHRLNISAMSQYKKRAIPLGCALSTDIFPPGTPMIIRTLEGDSDVEASEDILLMIGFEGEVYPIKSEKFIKSYNFTNQGFTKDYSYIPTIKNKITGETVQIISYAKSCIPIGQTIIYAMPVRKGTKVFNAWNPDGYMLGEIGDYIAVRADDHSDIYIIKSDIFAKTYDRLSTPYIPQA